jgi:hypothetical protein
MESNKKKYSTLNRVKLSKQYLKSQRCFLMIQTKIYNLITFFFLLVKLIQHILLQLLNSVIIQEMQNQIHFTFIL